MRSMVKRGFTPNPSADGSGYARISLVQSPPIIELTLNGPELVTVPLGANYVDAGATLRINGRNVSYRISVTGDVNTEIAGEYELEFSYTSDITDESFMINRTVNVVNMGSYQDFGFTGGVQEFTAPESGRYLLEVWGADGGSIARKTDSYW